jgi:hypothetical protein
VRKVSSKSKMFMHKNFCRYLIPCAVALFLSWIAIERTDFSYQKILIPLSYEDPELESRDVQQVLQQPFYFLGKGRQSFVFESEDGKTVLKFFNQKYFQIPWYAFAFPKERIKRRQREFFYLNSYKIAEKFLSKETAILYLHFGKTKGLPIVKVTDRASRSFDINLNAVPFVLQRKGEPLYAALKAIQRSEGNVGLLPVLDAFLELIKKRIAMGIGDADQDVEHNFGFLDGKPFHIDPGRLYLCDFSEKDLPTHQWWRATHSLRKWLQRQYPEIVPLFDERQKMISSDSLII